MPRVKPLPSSETDIGRRLAEARKDRLIHRTALALKIGISTDRLVSYESGRVKLPWGVGCRACEILGIGQHWLARGGDHYFAYIEVNPTELGGADIDRLPFGEVFSKIFTPWHKPRAAKAFTDVSALLKDVHSILDKAASNDVRFQRQQLEQLDDVVKTVQLSLDQMLKGPKKK